MPTWSSAFLLCVTMDLFSPAIKQLATVNVKTDHFTKMRLTRLYYRTAHKWLLLRTTKILSWLTVYLKSVDQIDVSKSNSTTSSDMLIDDK